MVLLAVFGVLCVSFLHFFITNITVSVELSISTMSSSSSIAPDTPAAACTCRGTITPVGEVETPVEAK